MYGYCVFCQLEFKRAIAFARSDKGALIFREECALLGLCWEVAGQADLQSDVALMHEHGKADR